MQMVKQSYFISASVAGAVTMIVKENIVKETELSGKCFSHEVNSAWKLLVCTAYTRVVPKVMSNNFL